MSLQTGCYLYDVILRRLKDVGFLTYDSNFECILISKLNIIVQINIYIFFKYVYLLYNLILIFE